jgi:glutathione S-transferase
MKLLNSLGPNPRMVRMFMAEKGISIPFESVDLLAGENRQDGYLRKNPAGQIPSLELDDGTVLSETVTICEYLEELHPTPALIGSNARERAETRMWVRRVELNVTEYMYNGFRFAEGLPLFEKRTRCLPEAASGLKEKAKDGLAWVDKHMAGKQFLCGGRLTLADLILYCCLDFCGSVGQPTDGSLKNLTAWFNRMDARPSAGSTIAPNWKELGMRV